MTTTVSGSYPAVNSDSDATINGLTVGKGTGAVATNTAIGFETLKANTTGEENVAVGYRALDANTTGTNSIAMGRNALGSNTTGSSNVAIGDSALVSNTTASSNAAFGSDALGTNTTGANNVAVGRSALQANTTASDNTAVGYEALYTNATGTAVTALGYKAGYASTGSVSVYVGFNCGVAATGSSNTFIGSGSGEAVTSGAKNTIVGRYNGNQGSLDIRTASNYIVLSDGDGNPRVVVNPSGQLHIGPAVFSPGTDSLRLEPIGRILSNCNTDWNQELYGNQTQRIRLFASNGSATEVGSITVNTTNAAFNTSSDYRLKENIAPMTGALAKVSALKPCTYTWKVDGSDGQGFIAHELAEVVPQAVTGEKDALDKDGNIKPQGIDTSFLVATLTAAIQELKAEFDAYKATHP